VQLKYARGVQPNVIKGRPKHDPKSKWQTWMLITWYDLLRVLYVSVYFYIVPFVEVGLSIYSMLTHPLQAGDD
jgi:hypothetical protein